MDKLEPLKPITSKQQDEFDRRREIASVVQNKCPKCGAWYETPKLQAEFRESFLCDCGFPMSFIVPAMDRTMLKDITNLDMDDRLDSGMKVGEAINFARQWWDKSGRHMMKKDGAKGHDFVVSLDPANPNYVPSGILNGEPWDQLDNRERLQIVKAWHHFNVSKPKQE